MPMNSLYMPLNQKVRHITEIPVVFRGDRNHNPDGAGAAQLRANVDAGHRADGDPSLCVGWDALSPAQQALLVADYTEWQAWIAEHGQR